MPEPIKNLGKLVSSHGTLPVFLQRAAIITVLSFVFFLAMLVAFYVRQHIGYFALSTAFLVVYVLTLISWITQKRNVVRIYENGIRYKKFSGSWDEIESGTILNDGPGRRRIELQKGKREKVSIPSSIEGFDRIVGFITANVKITS